MSKDREIAWPQIFAEGAAIVVSILLAFWIDAWWDERQFAIEERQVLTSLIDDFREKTVLVEWQRDYIGEILGSTKTLLYASSAEGPALSNSSIDRLLGDIWWNNEASFWSAPLLNSVVSGGDLSLISNRTLRNELVAWSERFDRIKEAIAREVDFYDDRLMPFMETNVEMRQILNAIEHAPGDPSFKYEFGEKFAIEVLVDHSVLLVNREFQGILARRSVLLNDVLTQHFNNLEEDLNEVISAIEAELVN